MKAKCIIMVRESQNKQTEFGKCLRELREEKKLTVRQLEAKSGASFSTISAYETGRIKPTRKTVALIAKGLEVNEEQALVMAGIPIGPDTGEGEVARMYRVMHHIDALGAEAFAQLVRNYYRMMLQSTADSFPEASDEPDDDERDS